MSASLRLRIARAVVARMGRRYAAMTDDELMEHARHSRPTPSFMEHRFGDGERVVLYLHGGAYTNGFQRQHWQLIRRIAAAGATVVAPDYPLAPEATWRDAFGPLVALAERLEAERGVPPILAGDSAGGGLAIALAQELVRRGKRVPVAALAPWTDLTGDHPPLEPDLGGDRWLTLNRLHACARAWAGGDDLERPELSPSFGDFVGIDRMLIICGTRDAIHPQSLDTVARAREAGVAVEYIEGPGLPHVYPLLPIPEARDARERLIAFCTRPAH